MNKEGIAYVLERIGAKNVLLHSNNIQCSCTVGWRHKKGFDNKPSMGISINDRDISLVNCFGCGYNGTLETMVSDIVDATGRDDITNLFDWITKHEVIDPEYIVGEIAAYDDYEPELGGAAFEEELIAPMMGKAHPYIIRRGIGIPTLKRWDVGYDQAARRVVFPLRDRMGRLCGMVGRLVKPPFRPKYTNYWEFQKGKWLYGEWQLQGLPKTTVVVEGPLDALYVWQALEGKVNVVALLGAKPSGDQMKKLARYCSEVILFLDDDEPGYDGREILRAKLFRSITVLDVQYPPKHVEPPGGDPSQVVDVNAGEGMRLRDPEQIKSMIAEARLILG